MNERIKELQSQAFLQCKAFEDGSVIRTDEAFEKFAELIVRECAERLMQDDFGSVKGVMSIAGARLKEHFGVK